MRTWDGQGCITEGHESVGREVAFQSKVRSTCRGSSSRGFACPPLQVGSHLFNICTEQNAWACLGAKGTNLMALCSQDPILLSFLPTFPVSPSDCLFYSITHRVLASGEKGRQFWEHIPVCCQLCWRMLSLSLPEQPSLTHLGELRSCGQLLSVSTRKCVPGPSCQVAQFLLLSVCVYQMPAGLPWCFLAAGLFGV